VRCAGGLGECYLGELWWVSQCCVEFQIQFVPQYRQEIKYQVRYWLRAEYVAHDNESSEGNVVDRGLTRCCVGKIETAIFFQVY
jgi:hypothetical protein